MWKSPEKCLLQRNRTGSPVENENSQGITQLVMAKNRSASKLIHYNQKQKE